MSLATSEPAARTALVFSALGDETRLALLQRLGRGSRSIVTLTAGTSVTRQAVTKHLKVLAAAGLVSERKAGREHLWEIATGPLDDARRFLEAMSQRWDDALDRLEAHVAEER